MQELNDKATVAQDCANNANNVLNYVNEKYDAVTSIASKINLYNEKFDKGLNNPELEQTEYVITVEQWRATNSGGKVELLRENLLYMYLDCGEDKEKTFNIVWKKINEKVKDTWVLALSNKEAVWLQKLLKDEIDRVNCF